MRDGGVWGDAGNLTRATRQLRRSDGDGPRRAAAAEGRV